MSVENNINKTFQGFSKFNKIDNDENSEDINFINHESINKIQSSKNIKFNGFKEDQNTIITDKKLKNKELNDNKSEEKIEIKEIKKDEIIDNENKDKNENEEHKDNEDDKKNINIEQKNNKIETETKMEENKELFQDEDNQSIKIDDLIDMNNSNDKKEENFEKNDITDKNKNNSDNKIKETEKETNKENMSHNSDGIKEKENIRKINKINDINLIQEKENISSSINNLLENKGDKKIQEKSKINEININQNNEINTNSNINLNNNNISKNLNINSFQFFNLKNNSKREDNSEARIIPPKIMEENKNSFDEIGTISLAKIHRDANRILKQINKFDKNTKFCPCCCLPCPNPNVLVQFKFCDDTDDFIETGQGTSLYFSFFKYSMIIMAATAIIIGIPFLIFSYKYTYALQIICNEYFNNENGFNGIIGMMNYCKLYITDEDYDDDYYSVVDSPFFLFSSVNIRDYREMFYKLYNKDKIDFEKSILSYPLLNLICSITLLIINILFIIIIYNRNVLYDFQLTSPSDYTVMITNMNQLLNRYLNVKKKYEDMKLKEPDKLNEDGTPFDFEQKLKEELGIEDINPILESRKPINGKISKLNEFKNFIENNICIDANKMKYNVQEINICFKLNKYMNLEGQLQQKKTQIVKINKHPYQISRNRDQGYEGDQRRYFSSFLSGYNLYWCNCFDKGKPLSQIEKEISDIEQGIIDLMKASEDMNQNNFAGVAFVSFNTLKEQEDFLSQFPSNIFSYFIKFIKDLKYIFCFCCTKKKLKTNLDAVVAPEPEDVIYENLEYSYIEGNFRTLIVYIISIILILICFGIFIGINILIDYVNDQAIHPIMTYVISLLNACVSSALNFCFQLILDFLTKMEKQYTMTEYYRSYSVKLTIFSFFTSAVVPLICELIKKSDGYQILVSNMLMMFLVNSFVTPIMWTMNFTYFLKKFRICMIERKSDADSKHNMTQRELNELYELPSMNISYKYSYLAKTLLMTFLYIPIFPLGIVISLVGFILGYFLEKFNFSHMYKRPEMLNHKLCFFYVNHFDVMIFVYSIGDYIFMNDSYKDKIIPLVKIIIFGVITIIPYKKFLRRNYIGMLESDISSAEYKDKYFTFSSDYERANPISRKKGIKHYLEKMLKSGKITRDKYLELLHEMDSLNLMEVYYKTRENKYLFDIQKSFAKAMGNKFISIKQELAKKINNEQNDNNDKMIIKDKKKDLYVKEENMKKDININSLEINPKDENELKDQDDIVNMYNNPNFMEYGCTMQLYQQVFDEKGKNLNDIIRHNNIIKEEDEEDKKYTQTLLKDKII